jgi:AcrR family transcriptional regulator
LPERQVCRSGSFVANLGTVTGLRERKKQATRLELSWAAIRLVVERGLAAVRLEDIAEEAGVSVRTVRNYFPSKADAIAYRHRERLVRIADELRARPAEESLWAAVRAAIETRFALGLSAGGTPDPIWTAGVRLMVTEPALQGAFHRADAEARAALAAAVAERTGTDPEHDLYPTLVAGAVGVAIGAAAERWLRADPPVPMEPLLAEAFDRITAGLPQP